MTRSFTVYFTEDIQIVMEVWIKFRVISRDPEAC